MAGKSQVKKRQLFTIVRREVTFPRWEDCWVEFRDDVLVDELLLLDETHDFEVIKEICADYIVNWSMWDAKEPKKKLPNPSGKPEVLGRLPLRLLIWCSVALMGVGLRGGPLPETEEEASPSTNGEA